MNKPELSIVIGALREEKRIGKTLNMLSVYLKKEDLLQTTEVLVVVANGGDRTKEVVIEYKGLFPHLKLIEPGAPVGKGRDIRVGMLTAEGKIRLYMDADLATPLHHIREALNIYQSSNADIVIGIRKLTVIHHDLLRRSISLIGNFCFLLVSGFYSPDTQCGFKAFSGSATEICFNKQTRLKWSFDMELLTIANINHLKVRQLRINDWIDQPNGTFRPSLGSSLRFFLDLARIFSNRLRGKYRI